MVRYKLTQVYPGSPDKGTIVYAPHREKAYQDPDGSNKYKMKDSRNCRNYLFFSADYIENHPKFWKKIR